MKKSLSLKCFSPPVMIATFVVEVLLAAYTVWRYKLNSVTRLVVAILLNLALFQLAEYNVCEGAFGIDGLSWSRLGYVAITTLPPLGYHLATKLARDTKNRRLSIGFAYATGVAFAGFFAFTGWGITSQACLGNYVIFETAQYATSAHAVYYYGWLIMGTVYAFYSARRVSDAYRAAALRALAVGYLSFMIPTTTANIVDPSTLTGIPSIMCGFAVILAVVLAGEVMPQLYGSRAISSVFDSGQRRDSARENRAA